MKPKPLKGRTWNPYTIPNVINPGKVRCIQVFIPDSLQWLQIFAAVMDTMCHWKNYELLGDTSAAECAALMRDIMRLYNTFETCDICDGNGQEFDGEELMGSLCEAMRVHDGKLQVFCCGKWADVDGQTSGGIGGGTAQPPAGGDIPADDCKSLPVVLSGRDRFLIPFPVDDGYTIEITDAQGGWWNGDVLESWECPDGRTYALGACVSAGSLSGSNPIPSLPYGRLIVQIGGTFFDAYNQVVTVPPGTGPTNAYLQINDSDLADNQGSISFNVNVCNKPVATWSKQWDFISESGPFVPETIGGTQYAQYIPGLGWANITPGASISMILKLIPPPGDYLHIELDVSTDVTAGNFSAGIDSETMWPDGVPTTGTYTWDGYHTNPAIVEFNPSGTPNSAHIYFTRCKMSGVGPSPF